MTLTLPGDIAECEHLYPLKSCLGFKLFMSYVDSVAFDISKRLCFSSRNGYLPLRRVINISQSYFAVCELFSLYIIKGFTIRGVLNPSESTVRLIKH